MYNVQCFMYNVLLLAADLVKLFGCGCYLLYNVLLCICSIAAIFLITRIRLQAATKVSEDTPQAYRSGGRSEKVSEDTP